MLNRLFSDKFARAVLGLMLLVYFGISARWILLYRDGGLYDIDESGYLTMAFNDYYGFLRGGWWSWLLAVENPNPQSPLTSALASFVFLIFGPHAAWGIFVPLLSCVITVVASYYLAKHLGGKLLGIATAALVATMPLMVIYSRTFHFGMPATAATTLALLALVKSNQSSRWNWICAFGFFVGMMPLARTMTIAFIPSLGLAAVIAVVAAEFDKWRRFGRLVVAGAIACATSLTWLLFNGKYVASYLFAFGYGARAAEYGQKQTLLQALNWLYALLRYQLHIAHFLIALVGVAAGAIVLVRSLLRIRDREQLRLLLASPVLSILIFVFFSFAALASSQNKGSAFTAPVIPAFIVLLTWSIWQFSKSPTSKAILTAIILFVALFDFIPLVDIKSDLAKSRTITLPFLGDVLLTDGQGTQEPYEEGFEVNTIDPGRLLPRDIARSWQALYENTLQEISKPGGETPSTAFGFRNPVYNVNTIQLAHIVKDGTVVHLIQIEPVVTSGFDGYKSWLQTGEAAVACNLVTSPGTAAEFRPYVDTALLESAAEQIGFIRSSQLVTPNGRPVTVWKRPCPVNAQ